MIKKNDIFESLALLESEKGLSVDYMIDKIKKSILTACKNNYNGNDNAIVDIDPDKNNFEVLLMKTAVEEVENDGMEIALSDAKKINPNVSVGDQVPIILDTKEFGRIAAQTARNIIRQGIRDGEREQMLLQFKGKYHEIVTATGERINDQNGNATIKIGKFETTLIKREQLPCDSNIKEGDLIKVYVVDVFENGKHPKVIVSRTHPEFVRKLLEQEVPEIAKGLVEIKKIARIAGVRSKVAVESKSPEIDPIGACIGTKGSRVSAVTSELGDEKVDIIEYKEDPLELIKASLAPAQVLDVQFKEGRSDKCVVRVDDSQFSLAIGNKGQNVTLAVKLTDIKIDIKHPLAENCDEASTEENLEQSENADTEEEQNIEETTDVLEPENTMENETQCEEETEIEK